eukprot:gene7561-8847_t
MTDSFDEHWRKERATAQSKKINYKQQYKHQRHEERDQSSSSPSSDDVDFDSIVNKISKSIQPQRTNMPGQDRENSDKDGVFIEDLLMEDDRQQAVEIVNHQKNDDSNGASGDTVITLSPRKQHAAGPVILTESVEDADDEYEEGDPCHDNASDFGEDMIMTEISGVAAMESNRRRIISVLKMDVLYLIVLAPLCYLCYFIPSTYLGKDEDLEYWDYSMQWSKYFIWMVCIIAGFTYVSMVTEKRNYPFYCRYERHRVSIVIVVNTLQLSLANINLCPGLFPTFIRSLFNVLDQSS